MPTLRPFRDYDEHDVINLFTLDGATLPANKGTVVQVPTGGVGWKNSDSSDTLQGIGMLGGAGADYANTVSQRYGVTAKVQVCGSGQRPLGMTLLDMRETDENGEKLLYNPRKAAEMGVVISGQAVPVLTRGIVLYSGATLTTADPAPGDWVYAAANGELSNVVQAHSSPVRVGTVLGKKDDNNHVLLKLEL